MNTSKEFYLYNCPDTHDYSEEEESKFFIIAQELSCTLTIKELQHTPKYIQECKNDGIDPSLVYIVTFSGEITSDQLKDKFMEHEVSISPPGVFRSGNPIAVIDYE